MGALTMDYLDRLKELAQEGWKPDLMEQVLRSSVTGEMEPGISLEEFNRRVCAGELIGNWWRRNLSSPGPAAWWTFDYLNRAANLPDPDDYIRFAVQTAPDRPGVLDKKSECVTPFEGG